MVYCRSSCLKINKQSFKKLFEKKISVNSNSFWYPQYDDLEIVVGRIIVMCRGHGAQICLGVYFFLGDSKEFVVEDSQSYMCDLQHNPHHP